ncbi:hypothetical protein [Brevibacillus dissolubilis]|uniref:hypothetical protein n=1 Tax=Brevibacillus dissolubilis TaxID=1844116 RepID=UPI00210004AB|nr:hypothetical protein [Brevibacillus dissolubilis]
MADPLNDSTHGTNVPLEGTGADAGMNNAVAAPAYEGQSTTATDVHAATPQDYRPATGGTVVISGGQANPTEGHGMSYAATPTPTADGTTNTTAAGADIYEQANTVLASLIHDLCDTLEVQDAEKFKRIGYQMIARYSQKPMNTGELTLIFASVLQDILAKLEMAEQNGNMTEVRDSYTIMRLEE